MNWTLAWNFNKHKSNFWDAALMLQLQTSAPLNESRELVDSVTNNITMFQYGSGCTSTCGCWFYGRGCFPTWIRWHRQSVIRKFPNILLSPVGVTVGSPLRLHFTNWWHLPNRFVKCLCKVVRYNARRLLHDYKSTEGATLDMDNGAVYFGGLSCFVVNTNANSHLSPRDLLAHWISTIKVTRETRWWPTLCRCSWWPIGQLRTIYFETNRSKFQNRMNILLVRRSNPKITKPSQNCNQISSWYRYLHSPLSSGVQLSNRC